MAEIAIRAENLSKRYRIGALQKRHDTLRDEIADCVRSFFAARRGERAAAEAFWALRDVSFDVHHGEVIGVIGRNGAGKSTLLKVLSRITTPTGGRARIYGRVGSLLEVGTGFHPELSGRENIFLNGAVLGMRKADIARRFDEIVAFSEIERFIDTPVKHYSSGMYVRLAFAVAAHLEPEILLVDEVLAVGDAAFQKKCLGKMGEVAREGRTVLFISHNMNAISELCTRAILLDRGTVKAQGEVPRVVGEYLATGESQPRVDLDAVQHKGPGTYARLKRLLLLNKSREPATSFTMNDPFIAEIEVEVLRRMVNAEVGLRISSALGTAIHYLTSTWSGLKVDLEPGRHRFEVKMPHILLYPGRYQIGLWTLRDGEWSDDNVQEVTYFEVLKGDVAGHPTTIEKYAFSGCEVFAPSEWKIISGTGDQKS